MLQVLYSLRACTRSNRQFIRDLCRHHARSFTASTYLSSGHSRWSKIRHDKGKNDAKRGNDFSKIAIEIIEMTKQGGPDPTTNLRLQYALDKAKKAGMAKAGIESAIRRGQGISASGAPLEGMLVECIGPGGVAMVVSCLTDSKARTLQNVRNVIRSNEYTVGPTLYFFERKGYAHVSPPLPSLPPSQDSSALDDENTLLDLALTLNLDDIEPIASSSEEPTPSLYEVTVNDISRTTTVVKELADALPAGWEIVKSGLQYVANPDTVVEIEEEGELGEQLRVFVEKLEDDGDVVEVYMNADFV